MKLKELIREVPDFPAKGILFRDISPILKSPQAIEFVVKNLFDSNVIAACDYFVGVESRGFILASLLAQYHSKGFVPLRKAGKLPPPVIGESYSLEYGKATIEMNPGKGKVLLVDDVLATGGTLAAAISVCQKAGYEVLDVGVLIDLKFLNQFKFNNRDVRSLVQYS